MTQPTLLDLTIECMETLRPLVDRLNGQDGDAELLAAALKRAYGACVDVFEAGFWSRDDEA